MTIQLMALKKEAFGEGIWTKMNSGDPPCPQLTVWLSGLRGQGFTSDGHRLLSLYRAAMMLKKG